VKIPFSFPDQGARDMPKIYIMNGPDKGRSFEVDEESIFIGRAPDNEIHVSDKSVSRKHLKIVKRGEKYYVTDLGSKNGTFIDGIRITGGKEYEVREGMPIAAGKTFLSVGKAYPDDVLAVLDSIDLFKELDEEARSEVKDRPSTAKRNMDLIYKVSNVLMQSLNMKEVMERILHYILELLKRIDRGVIILIDPDGGQTSEVISIIKSNKDDCKAAYSRTVVDRVIKERTPVSMLDTLEEKEINLSESIRSSGIRSIMCVPLISRSKVMGVIYVDSVNKPHGFRKEDLDLLTALSSPAAVAIENSLLYSKYREGMSQH
jgi:pSer/pThr/pTyr-binding forkhead associated (FHA) protein